jgi:hypothetical protein
VLNWKRYRSQKYFSQSRNDATTRRGVLAPLRETFMIKILKQLAACDTELNRKLKVQERDATMMKEEQMPGAKNKHEL